MDLEIPELANNVTEVKSNKKPSTFPLLNILSSIWNFLPPFGLSVLLYTVGLLVSWVAAGGNGLRFWGLAGSIGIFWLVWFGFGRTRRYRELYFLTLGLVVILAILGLLTLPMLDDDYLRTNSVSDKIIGLVKGLGLRLDWLTMHRNTLAGMLAVFGPLALAFTFFGRRWWERLVGLGAGLAIFATLLATNGRGPLVAFGVGIVLLIILKGKEVKRPKFFFLHPYTLLIIGFLLTVGYITVSGQWKLFTPERLANENGLGRVEVWQNSLLMIEDVPITGAGIGNFKGIYSFYVDSSDNSGRASQENAHNLFLQSYVELGLAGFLAVGLATAGWIWVLGGILRKRQVEKLLPQNKPELNPYPASYFQRGLLRGGLAAFGAMLVYGLAEHSAWYGQWVVLFWLPLALLSSSMGKRSPEPGVRSQNFLRDYLANNKRRWVALGFVIPVAAVVVWQLWGFVELNRAGLEKLRVWQGDKNTSAEHVAILYREAASSVNWTGVPLRGLSWANLATNNYASAESSLQEGLSNNPNDKQLLLQMGDLKEHQGDHQAALNFWRKAKAAEVYYWRGRKWMDIENEDAKAEPYFLNTIEIDPYHWGGYEFLVMLYQRHSRTPDAITLLAKAVVLFPDNPRPAQMLADLIQNR